MRVFRLKSSAEEYLMTHYKTGGDIDTACTRCKLELAHIIIAMNGPRVVRVECKTCRTVHAYRGKISRTTPKTTRSPSSAPSGATSRNKVTRQAAQFDDRLVGLDISRASRYRATETYGEDSVIDHPIFGLGIVGRLLSDSKIEVQFRIGPKVLVHAR